MHEVLIIFSYIQQIVDKLPLDIQLHNLIIQQQLPALAPKMDQLISRDGFHSLSRR